MSELFNDNVIDVAEEIEAIEDVSEKVETLSDDTVEAPMLIDDNDIKDENLPINEELQDIDESIVPEEPKVKKTVKKKIGPKTTRTDVMDALREREELKERRSVEREEKSLKWHIIQEHFHRKKIAKGTLISVEETSNGMVIAVIDFNGFRVIVPAAEFFVKPIAVEEGVSKQQRIRREKQVIVKSLGAEVEFVIVHATQEVNKETKAKEYVIIASRKQALLRQIKYYFEKVNDGRRIEPGKIIRNVPIIAVGKDSLMVSVCGIDKTMAKPQLSYKFLGNLGEAFKVGDKIDLAVLAVEEKESGAIDLTVSHKQTQLDMFRRNVQNCSVGGMYRGKITIVRDDNVQLYLTDVDVPAYSKILKLNNIEELPSAGDTVLFVAHKIVPEKGIVLGTIIRYIKS